MHEYIKVCEHAARRGGETLLKWQGQVSPREKAPKDLVSEADFASQQVIYDVIHDAFPDHDFLGEEAAPDTGNADARDIDTATESAFDFRWIVDPLDGTVNYIHQLPAYSVSVALECRGELLAGVIYNPVADECFSATRGGGATLNGEKISVSNCQTLSTSLVAASLSTGVSRNSEEVHRFLEILTECQGLRRIGSAALNLAYVASGRLDAYWATSVKIWDVAAGLLLVQEAGGQTNGIDGNPIDLSNPRFAVAATSACKQNLLPH